MFGSADFSAYYLVEQGRQGVDVHGYGKQFIVRADEKLTAFLERRGRYMSLRSA